MKYPLVPRGIVNGLLSQVGLLVYVNPILLAHSHDLLVLSGIHPAHQVLLLILPQARLLLGKK